MPPIALTMLLAYTGDMESDRIKLIEARRGEIKKLINDLQREEDELGITLRVLQRFSPDKSDDLSTARLGPRRPEGTPTTFQMVESVLSQAESAGKDSLVMSEILAAIEKQYWPGLVSAQIAPSIYQFATQGRLHKTAAGRFKRIKNNEKGPET